METADNRGNEIGYMKQLEVDTNRLVSDFGASSVIELIKKPSFRWLQ